MRAVSSRNYSVGRRSEANRRNAAIRRSICRVCRNFADTRIPDSYRPRGIYQDLESIAGGRKEHCRVDQGQIRANQIFARFIDFVRPGERFEELERTESLLLLLTLPLQHFGMSHPTRTQTHELSLLSLSETHHSAVAFSVVTSSLTPNNVQPQQKHVHHQDPRSPSELPASPRLIRGYSELWN